MVFKNNNIIEEQIIDFKYYEDLSRGDTEFLNKLIVQTINLFEEFKANYTRYFDENNITELRSAIHKAKSSISKVNKLIEITSKGKELLLQNENDDIIRQSHLKSVHHLVDSAIETFNKKLLAL